MTRAAYTPQPGTIPHKVITHLRTLPAGTELTTAVLAESIAFDTSMNLFSYLRAAVDGGALKTSKKNGERWVWWSLGDGKPVTPPSIDDGESNDDDQAARKPPSKITAANSVFALPFSNGAPLKPARNGKGDDIDVVRRKHNGVIEMEPPAPAPAALAWTAPPGGLDAHEHFARTTIDQAQPIGSKQGAKPEVKPITSTEPRCNVREYVKAIDRVVPADPPPPAPAAPLPRVRAGTTPYRFGIFNDGEFVQEKGGVRIVIDRDELEQLVRFLDRMRGEEAA